MLAWQVQGSPRQRETYRQIVRAQGRVTNQRLVARSNLAPALQVSLESTKRVTLP
jgi:hypothetical protein